MVAKISKAEQSARTRTALLTAARELFATQGYANTATEAIVRRAGVTRGALYYHFKDKASLFQAVFIEVESAMQRTIAQSVMEAEGDIWQRIKAGSSTFFRLCLEPDIQRILYVDGPAVLNKDSWQSGGAGGGMNIVRQNLQAFMDHGYIEEYPLEALTHIWFGVYAEAALYIVRAEAREIALAEAERCVEALANGLRLQAQLAATAARESSQKAPPKTLVLRQIEIGTPDFFSFWYARRIGKKRSWISLHTGCRSMICCPTLFSLCPSRPHLNP